MGLMDEPLYLLVHSRNLDLEVVKIEPQVKVLVQLLPYGKKGTIRT